MRWTFLAALAIGLASVAAGAPTRAAPADKPTESYDSLKQQAPAWREALPATRRSELRCAMIAALIVDEVGRGVRKKYFGLTEAKSAALADGLAAAIIAENGYSDAQMRAIFNADFEAFFLESEAAGGSEADRKAALAATIAVCQPLYDSIDLSGDGDGKVAGLAPLSGAAGVDMPGPAQCYAILSAIAGGMPKGSKERAEFDDMIGLLAPRVTGEAGDSDAGQARLAAAIADFDAKAFEALDEPAAEAQLVHCFGLAA